jgi:hypothetical protein
MSPFAATDGFAAPGGATFLATAFLFRVGSGGLRVPLGAARRTGADLSTALSAANPPSSSSCLAASSQ